MAEEADRLAQRAYKLFTGNEPDLYHPVYDQDSFRWNGYDAAADKLFKMERLRCFASRPDRPKKLAHGRLELARGQTKDCRGGFHWRHARAV